MDGAKLLERASPLVGDLAGSDRKAAASGSRGFGIRLNTPGGTALAECFEARAKELAQSSCEKPDAVAVASLGVSAQVPEGPFFPRGATRAAGQKQSDAFFSRHMACL